MGLEETPILNTLNEYLGKDPIRLHVPYHGGVSNNSDIPSEIYNLDISEVTGFDRDESPISESEKITSDLFNVRHSFYLANGASEGILASLFALKKFGKKVVISRNVHKSVINAIVISGLEPIWLEVDFLSDWGIFSSISNTRLEDILKKEKDVAGVVIVSPTYEGTVSDIGTLSTVCHKYNVPLIVDEAHGAHLFFLNDIGLYSAIQKGADLVIQSWHKSLGSLTQSAVLHLVNEDFFSYNDIKRTLDLFKSTSPSFLLLLSLELTRAYMYKSRGEEIVSSYTLATNVRRVLKELTGLFIFDSDDLSKLYVKSESMSGVELGDKLFNEYSIEVESVNNTGLLMILSRSFNIAKLDKMIFSFKEILSQGKLNIASKGDLLQPKTKNFSKNPQEAFVSGYDKKGKAKNLSVESEIVAACPPGYATVIPGSDKC